MGLLGVGGEGAPGPIGGWEEGAPMGQKKASEPQVLGRKKSSRTAGSRAQKEPQNLRRFTLESEALRRFTLESEAFSKAFCPRI